MRSALCGCLVVLLVAAAAHGQGVGGCAGCGSGLLSASLPPPELLGLTGPGPDGDLFPQTCGCCGEGPGCVPGRRPCQPCVGDSWLTRFGCALYGCICCPDPCYEGKWTPLADSALFCEAVRPITQTKLRWDSGNGFVFPDRNEYFWPRADGTGLGPKPKAPYKGEFSLRHNDLLMISEGGTGMITLTVETPYRNLQAREFGHAAGFGDMNMTTKTLLFDCELLQVSMLFRTYIPIGSPLKGLGVGHVSLEPGVAVGIKLTPTTYLQTQVMEWIPLGGDPEYAGSILHYHASLNQLLYRILPDVPLIGTFEFAGYSFQDGKYTDPFLGAFQKSSGTTYAYAGSGLRLFICDKFDVGFGGMFALTEQHFAREMFRLDFRARW